MFKIKENNLVRLEREIKALRSALIGFVGRDDEGLYRPEFVRRVLRLQKKQATHAFKNPRQFLQELSGV